MIKFALKISVLFFIVSSCSNDDDTRDPLDCPNCPFISSFSPTEAFPGDTLLIQGGNYDAFDSSNSENKVTINGIDAIYINHTSSELRVEVTDNASTGEVQVCATNKGIGQDNILCSQSNPEITILSETLKAQFEIGDITNNGFAPATVQFINTSTFADRYEWDFGDPTSGELNTSEEENPVHVYLNPGDYSVSLKVINKDTNNQEEFSLNILLREVMTFDRTFGVDEIPKKHIQLKNNNYAIIGHTLDGSEIILLILDQEGNELRTSTFRNGEENIANSIIEGDNGMLAITGSIDGKIFILFADQEGNIMQGSLKIFENGVGNSIIHTDNNGYAITGNINRNGNQDIFLIITDENGNEVEGSGKFFGGGNTDSGNEIIQTESNNLAIVGTSESFGDSDGDIILIQTDENGNEFQNLRRTYGGNNTENGISIVERKEGGFIVVGNTESFGDGPGENPDINDKGDVYLLLTNETGDELPESGVTFSTTSDVNQLLLRNFGTSVVELENGNIVVLSFAWGVDGGVFTFPPIASLDVFVSDSNANEISRSNIALGQSLSNSYNIIETSDGGLSMLVNHSLRFRLIKITRDGQF